VSPVSKGRKNKKRGPRRSGYQPAEPADVRELPSWFATSITAVLDKSDALLGATGPREAEQITCELLGEQLHRVVHGAARGLWFDWWFEELVDAAAARVRNVDDLGGEWLLLHGLAAVGSPALRSFARNRINNLLKVAKQRPGYARLPRWLTTSHLVKATDEVWRMQNAYGTRFAVIAGMSYPHGTDPSVFLFDIDACGFITVVNAGAFDDVTQAATAWRALVGDTADGTEPVEVHSGEQLSCLAYAGTGDESVLGDETRERFDNWFRANRCAHDLADALKKSRRMWPQPVSLYEDLDIEPMATEFSGWYNNRHGGQPDQEAVEALAVEWIEGTLPETLYLISPHRIEFRRILIADGWSPEDPVTVAMKSLLREWTQWLGERSGLPAELVDRATAMSDFDLPADGSQVVPEAE
jgi:hypothetical protein